jgi:predicted nuclease with TOPRIM domain
MDSAKDRLHDVFRKGHPGSTGPDYRRALEVLADVIDDVDGRVDQISEGVETKETDHDALSGLFGRYDEMIDDLRNRISRVDDRVERMDEKQNQAYDWIDDLGVRLGEVDDRLGYAAQDLLGLRDRDETLADRIDGLQGNINEVWSRLKSLHSRFDDVEKGQDVQDTYMNDLRDATETAKADAEKALERLVAHAKTHQQLRQAIEDVEQTADDTDALLTDVLTELELGEEQWSPLGLDAGGSWGGWHEDEQKANPPARDAGERVGEDTTGELPLSSSALEVLVREALDEDQIGHVSTKVATTGQGAHLYVHYRGMDFCVFPELLVRPATEAADHMQRQKAASIEEKLWDHRAELVAEDESIKEGEDLPHAPHEELADDVRDVFPNAVIAVRQSDEQPGLDVEVGGVSYYVHPNRSVEEKTDGWKLERTRRAWLVEQVLTFVERRPSEQ